MEALGINLGLLIVQIIAFIIVFLTLNAWVYKPMLDMMETRKKKISAPDRDEQIAQVDRVLEEIGAGQVPRILVYNKIDRIGRAPEVALDRYGRIDRVWTSAAVGVGLDLLREAIDQQVSLWRDARRHGAAPGAQDADADAAESLEHPEHRAA